MRSCKIEQIRNTYREETNNSDYGDLSQMQMSDERGGGGKPPDDLLDLPISTTRQRGTGQSRRCARSSFFLEGAKKLIEGNGDSNHGICVSEWVPGPRKIQSGKPWTRKIPILRVVIQP